jgi:hypothetical protein
MTLPVWFASFQDFCAVVIGPLALLFGVLAIAAAIIVGSIYFIHIRL